MTAAAGKLLGWVHTLARRVARWGLGPGRLRFAPSLAESGPVMVDPEDDGPPESIQPRRAGPALGHPIDGIYLPTGVLKVPDGTTVQLGQLADGTYFVDWHGLLAPTWYPAAGPGEGANPFGDNPLTPARHESVTEPVSPTHSSPAGAANRLVLG